MEKGKKRTVATKVFLSLLLVIFCLISSAMSCDKETIEEVIDEGMKNPEVVSMVASMAPNIPLTSDIPSAALTPAQSSMREYVLEKLSEVLTAIEPEPTPESAPESVPESVPTVSSKATSSKTSSVTASSKAPSKPTLKQLKSKTVAELKKLNPDVYGKLTVAGGPITEPVVHVQDIEEYLRYDFYHNYDRYGTVHVEPWVSDTELDFNTVVSGHNRGKNLDVTKMFAPLEKFRENGYATENPDIVLETLYGKFSYKIFSVFVHGSNIPNSEYSYSFMRTDYGTFEEKDFALNKLKSMSLYDTGVQVNGNDKMITLVTCTYRYEGKKLINEGEKLIVIGKLVSSEYYETPIS